METESTEEATESVAKAVHALESKVQWRWREQGIPDFLEDLSDALVSLRDILGGLAETPDLQVGALVLLSGLSLALAEEAMEARSYYVQQNPAA